MTNALNLTDVSSLGTILCVWAHPDDETFCAGGLLAAAVANGQRVVCVTATRGELGVQDETKWPQAQLGEIRSKELAEALEILGIQEHYWLDCEDGKCGDTDRDAKVEIQKIIYETKPDTIITFGPDGLTGHPDHIAVSGWVKEAVNLLNITPNIYHTRIAKVAFDEGWKLTNQGLNTFFNVNQPLLVNKDNCDLYIELSPELLAQKLSALQAMPSQYQSYFETCSLKSLQHAWRTEAFVLAK